METAISILISTLVVLGVGAGIWTLFILLIWIKKNPQVKCYTCKHYVDKIDTQKIKVTGGYGEDSRCFCPLCRVDYNSIIFETDYSSPRYIRVVKYYKNVEVSQSGEIKQKIQARIIKKEKVK